jgi:hypothetical protein
MKQKTVLTIFCISVAAFYAGYQVGQKQSSPNALEAVESPNTSSQQSPNETDLPHAWTMLPSNADNNNGFTTSSLLPIIEAEDDSESDDTSLVEEPFQWRDPGDIISMFNQLIELSEPKTDEDMRLFSQAIDLFRAALANSPTQVAIIAEYLQTLTFGSKEFHYITSLLQGLPEQKGLVAIENLALQLSQRSDSASIQQFLHLVSNAQNSADNPEILGSLVNIAIYSAEPTETKIEALDMVMPFQISEVERQQILSGLNSLLEQSENTEKGALLNHKMRFSERQQRQEIAMSLISNDNDLELRYTVIDGLHSGNIPRSSALKEQLFSIATDPNDPLRQQAKHALMYSFDINNQEYQRLKTQ